MASASPTPRVLAKGGNPHLAALQLRRRHQAQVEGLGARGLRALAGLLGLALLVPLASPVFLHFLGKGETAFVDGFGGVLFRASVLLISVLAIDVYTALVRGADRSVLALLPVAPEEVVVAELRRLAADRAPFVFGLAALLVPVVAAGHPLAWALGLVHLVGTAALGLTASAMVHLLAVQAAEDPRFASILDLLRGQNPRSQAAFLYAPGVVLGGAGLLLMQSSFAAPRLAAAPVLLDVVWLVLPLVASAACWRVVPGLARAAWFDASTVVAEIDARYASLMDAEESRRAYLDWLVRYVPTASAVWLLKDLRHGWRARRTWISAAWGVGLAAAMAGWTVNPAAPARALAVVVAGTLLCGTVSILMETDEPEFLRSWLPPGGLPRVLARLVVLVAWLQPVVLLPLGSIALRHGLSDAAWLGLTAELAVLGAALAAWLCGRLRERGLWVYGPGAAVASAAVAGLLLAVEVSP